MSGGSGGQVGKIDTSHRDSQGAQARYEMTVPQDVHSRAKPYGLLIYLHGDNYNELRGGYFQGRMAQLGQRYNLLPIAVYSPDLNRQSGSQWWGGNGRHADFLHDLLQKRVGQDYNVDFSKVYLYGMSGGSQFVTKYFIPRYGEFYAGGVAPMCGGNSSEQYEPVRRPDIVKNNFRFFFYTHGKDFLYSAVRKTVAYFQRLGFSVQYESPPTAPSNRSGNEGRRNHCYKTGNDKMEEILASWLGNDIG